MINWKKIMIFLSSSYLINEGFDLLIVQIGNLERAVGLFIAIFLMIFGAMNIVRIVDNNEK